MNAFELMLERIIPLGRIFFSTTMILYGCSHFVYTAYVSPLVPAWFGAPVFWTYFGGVALIGSGIAIILKIWIKPVAFLLAIMLLLWFIFLHVPNALTHPYLNNGNEVVSAFDALMFCGIALVIASTNNSKEIKLSYTSQLKQYNGNMITKAFAEEFARDWINDWNAHDLEKILTHYADDFVIETPMAFVLLPESKGIVSGKYKVREYWQIGLNKNKKPEFKMIDLLIGVNSLTIYYINNATGKKAVEVMSFNNQKKVNKALVNYSE